jgi:hypothetical protein
MPHLILAAQDLLTRSVRVGGFDLRQQSTNGFLGQLQSSLGERIEVWLVYSQLELRVVDQSGKPVKRELDRLTIGVDEIDNLQGLLLQARMRSRDQL